MVQYLFVYGTLRGAARHTMHKVLQQYARLLGPATLQGRLYQVAHYPGAVLSDDPAQLVVGELYQLIQHEPALAALDEYEECSAQFALPHEYRRQVAAVMLTSGERVNAWVYLYNRSCENLALIVSGDFMQQDAL